MARGARERGLTGQLRLMLEMAGADPTLGARPSEPLGRPVSLSDTPPEHDGTLERAVPACEGGFWASWSPRPCESAIRSRGID